jgi:hypothetical protein
VCGGFANKRESHTYDSAGREKNNQKHSQHHIFWGECFSSSVQMYAFLCGNMALVVFSRQSTDNCLKRHDSITGTVIWLITVPVIFQSVTMALPVW